MGDSFPTSDIRNTIVNAKGDNDKAIDMLLRQKEEEKLNNGFVNVEQGLNLKDLPEKVVKSLSQKKIHKLPEQSE